MSSSSSLRALSITSILSEIDPRINVVRSGQNSETCFGSLGFGRGSGGDDGRELTGAAAPSGNCFLSFSWLLPTLRCLVARSDPFFFRLRRRRKNAQGQNLRCSCRIVGLAEERAQFHGKSEKAESDRSACRTKTTDKRRIRLPEENTARSARRRPLSEKFHPYSTDFILQCMTKSYSFFRL